MFRITQLRRGKAELRSRSGLFQSSCQLTLDNRELLPSHHCWDDTTILLHRVSSSVMPELDIGYTRHHQPLPVKLSISPALPNVTSHCSPLSPADTDALCPVWTPTRVLSPSAHSGCQGCRPASPQLRLPPTFCST